MLKSCISYKFISRINIIVLLCVILNFQYSYAQVIEKENMQYKGSKYDIVILKVDSVVCNRFQVYDNTSKLNEFDLFNSFSKPVFMINAGSVDTSCNLLGLYVNSGVKITDINTSNSSSGNFYLKPNGFIGFNDNEAMIKNTDDYNTAVSYTTAVQNGPMLITQNTINNKFIESSKNKFQRAGVGIYQENGSTYLVFAKSLLPVNFYQFASLFLDKYKCENALCLESGSFCSLKLPSSQKKGDKNKTVCKYLMFTLK